MIFCFEKISLVVARWADWRDYTCEATAIAFYQRKWMVVWESDGVRVDKESKWI